MPYTDDPEHIPADKVRFLVGDTDVANPRLSDNEIAALLADEGSNPLRAAARAAETLVGKYTASAETKQVGLLRLSHGTSLVKKYQDLARTLWARVFAKGSVPYAGGISVNDKRTFAQDHDRVKPAFSRAMMHYPNGDTSTKLSSSEPLQSELPNEIIP